MKNKDKKKADKEIRAMSNCPFCNNKGLIKKQYCAECGTKLETHLENKYDVFNGNRLIGTHCPNLFCKEGCEFVGHRWGKTSLDRGECQRCECVM